jgi:tetratricopeptide (TPR) repeat protein
MTQNQGFPPEAGRADGAGEAATAAPPPEQLFAQALALNHAGQLAQADNLYRAVLAADPNHIGSLHHLGIIALATGRHEDAKTFLAKALALNERSSQCHYHMGLVFALLGSMDDAAAHNKRAIELDPDYADAHLNLGNVFKAQGNLSDAAACYQRVLALRAKAPEAHYNLANVLSDQGQFDAAIAHYRAALALVPNNPDVHNNLGTALAAKGDWNEAAARYRHALALKPALIETYANLASVLLAAGDAGTAIGVVARGLSIRETPSIKTLFVQCVRAIQSFPQGKEFRDLVMRALAEAWGRPGDLAACALALVKQNSVLHACIDRATAAWPQRLPAPELFAEHGLAAACNDLLFHRLLESTPVTEIALERFLTGARFAVLEVAGKASAADEPSALGFYCALARQCFINEYVFDALDAEWEEARRLRDLLVAALRSASPVPVLWPVAVASYFPLHSVPGADALVERNWPDSVAGLLVQQLREPAEERRIRASIPALTAITNDVSLTVRRQYEENPYPRWVGSPPLNQPVTFDQYMRRQFPLAAYRDLGKGNVASDRRLRHRPAFDRRGADAHWCAGACDRSQSEQPCLRQAQDDGARPAQRRICPGGHPPTRLDRSDVRRRRFDRRIASSCGSVDGLANPALASPAGGLHAHRSLQRIGPARRHGDDGFHCGARLWPYAERHQEVPTRAHGFCGWDAAEERHDEPGFL